MSFSRRQILVAILYILLPAIGLAEQTAPDWTLLTSDGLKVNLAEEAGKQTTILFFWATWCPYCKALMPHLQSIRLEYGDSVNILAIIVFEDGDPIEFMDNAGYDFTVLSEGDAVAKQYDVSATPGLFIIDASRTIRFDLRKLPMISPPNNGEKTGHSRRAAFLAPYWAAEIRQSIDQLASEPQ